MPGSCLCDEAGVGRRSARARKVVIALRLSIYLRRLVRRYPCQSRPGPQSVCVVLYKYLWLRSTREDST